MHVPSLNMCQSKTSEKIFTFYIENTEMRICCGVAGSSASQN